MVSEADQPMQIRQTDHLNGPRTLWMQLRDNVGMTAEVVEQGIRLERGRHPTLSELRAELGLDLDLSAAFVAAREHAIPPGTAPSDEQMQALLDAMYRSLSSTRMVRLDITVEGLLTNGPEEPIRMREGERLVLFIMADNQTDSEADFAAEAGRERISGRVEPRRTASALLHCPSMAAGSHLLALTTRVGRHRVRVSIPVECEPSRMLTVRVIDDSDSVIPARVCVSDSVDAAWPGGARVRRDEHGRAFFHTNGEFEVRVSGETKIAVQRGTEYEPAELVATARAGRREELTARLKRWSNLAQDGWRSGDVHVHLHYGGEYLLTPEDASLAQRAEDVHFMNMMVANQGSGFVHDTDHFEGRPHQLSTADHILRWGEEYRNNFYGHLCMYGITELVPPIYSGFRQSEHPNDMPALADGADRCHAVAGTLSYAHPMSGSIDLDRVFARVRTVEAKELPVDAALGKVDAVDLMSYPSSYLDTAELWYRLLNCGLRLPATAGTDTFMNHADAGVFSNPPAGNRVFVKIEGAFTTESWCEGVRRGRTFVTNGPALRLSVNGRGVGDEIKAQPGDVVEVEAEAHSFAPMGRIELIVNREVVASSNAIEDGRRAHLSERVTVNESSWIAFRALGPPSRLVLGGDLFAHSSPVYVSIADQALVNPLDGAYFVSWIDRLIDMAIERGSYSSDADRDRVVALFRSGQEYYRRFAQI